MLKDKDKAMLASYGRSMLAAVVALAVTGNTDPGALLAAAIGAVCPTALRYINPKDLRFGRGSSKA
jgi:hypothetical protein